MLTTSRIDRYYAWWSDTSAEDFTKLLKRKIRRDLEVRGVLVADSQTRKTWGVGIRGLDVFVQHSHRCPCEICGAT